MSNLHWTKKFASDKSSQKGLEANMRSLQHLPLDRGLNADLHTSSIQSKSQNRLAARQALPNKTNSNLGSLVPLEQGRHLSQYVDAKKYMSTGTTSGRLFHL